MPFYSFVIPSPSPRSSIFSAQLHASFSPKLQDYDDLLRSILSDITNVSLEEDSFWAQASLPIEAGGLGIHRAVQLAPSAFLASVAGCFELVERILPCTFMTPTSHFLMLLLLLGRKAMRNHPLLARPPTSRRFGTLPGFMQAISNLESSPDPCTRARLLAVASKECGT